MSCPVFLFYVSLFSIFGGSFVARQIARNRKQVETESEKKVELPLFVFLLTARTLVWAQTPANIFQTPLLDRHHHLLLTSLSFYFHRTLFVVHLNRASSYCDHPGVKLFSSIRRPTRCVTLTTQTTLPRPLTNSINFFPSFRHHLDFTPLRLFTSPLISFKFFCKEKEVITRA